MSARMMMVLVEAVGILNNDCSFILTIRSSVKVAMKSTLKSIRSHIMHLIHALGLRCICIHDVVWSGATGQD